MLPHRKLRVITTAEIATRAGITPSSVLGRARARGVRPAMVAGRVKLWTVEDAKLLMVDIGRGWTAKRQHELFGGPAARPSTRRKAG